MAVSELHHPPFPYPGGKKRFASWIISRLPAHQTYVEAFGGSAAVLAAKDRSEIEIYNDANGDLVQFFEVLREDKEALVEWLRKTPYSRELYDRWVRSWQDGDRPDDAVERAGEFFFLRSAQFSAKTGQVAGFSATATRPQASYYTSRIDRLDAHAERFQSVVLEHLDWREVLERYDSDETVFYFDPPYGDNPGIYGLDEFDHNAFFDAIQRLNADWLVSYQEHPSALEEYHSETYESAYKMGQNGDGADQDRSMTEHLITSYDPDDTPRFVEREQLTIDAATDGGERPERWDTGTDRTGGGGRE